MNARDVALNTLYKIEVGEAYSNIALDKELNTSNLTAVDKALASTLVYGVLTWKITLDEIVKRYSKIKLKKISPWIINILRMGIYQIVFMDRIPQSAAVNESVKLSKKYGHVASSNFVNAILRKIDSNEFKKLEEYLDTLDIKDEEKISIITSHPIWMVNKLLKDYDKNFVIELLNANNKIAGITLRVNTLKTTRDALIEKLKEKGADAIKGNLQDSVFVQKLHSFEGSDYIVQDEAAQLSVLKLEPKENEIILDACSSPGGKTTYISAIINNTGRVDAWDIHEHRVELVKKNAEKLGVTNINAIVKDAANYYEELLNTYDKILLDVPCSGLGVIRKKPDIKWTRKEEDIEELSKIQEKILCNCSKYLKSGGTLIYSTCTILKEENDFQIEKFLEKNKEFELVEKISLFPNVDGTDGFFIAKMKKL